MLQFYALSFTFQFLWNFTFYDNCFQLTSLVVVLILPMNSSDVTCLSVSLDLWLAGLLPPPPPPSVSSSSSCERCSEAEESEGRRETQCQWRKKPTRGEFDIFTPVFSIGSIGPIHFGDERTFSKERFAI